MADSPIQRLHGSNHIRMINTPTGQLTIMRSVAMSLLAEGVISGDIDGELHANDAATVKAAMMAHGICDFCSAPGAAHTINVPDFQMPIKGVPNAPISTGGWAACDVCNELVITNRRKDLLNRSINSLAFSKFTKGALADLHNRFWVGVDGMVVAKNLGQELTDFVNDKLPDEPQLVDWKGKGRAERIHALTTLTKMTAAEIDQIIGGDVPPELGAKLLDWSVKFKASTAADVTQLVGGPRKPVADIMPHWQRALDGKVEVMQTLGSFLRHPDTKAEMSLQAFPEAIDIFNPKEVERVAKAAQARQMFNSLGFDTDYRLMKTAEVYSFNAETEAAIIEASSSIPHNAPLSSIETPTGCGWFWFGEPLNVASSPFSSTKTHALLWAWEVADDGKRPVLMFSAYVRNEKGNGAPSIRGKLLPSTRWYWPLEMSFHDMLKLNAASWLKNYGPGTPMEHDQMIMGQQETVNAIADLSLFFAQSCIWFRQTVPGTQKKLDPILTKEVGHIERHARKRAQKAMNADAPPVVHVVALRRTAKTAVDPDVEKVSGLGRDYQCRWIVKGHNRMQACGPGRKDRKLIWIESHPAGPEDKPLRSKTTVFAVVR